MSDVNPGYAFTPTEQVTNTKLASLAGGAFDPTCISGRSVDSTVQNVDRVLYWQSSSSTLRAFTISALAAQSTAGLVGKNVAQTAHGFSVGNVLYWTGTAYAAAEANAIGTSVVAGVVSFVTDGNNFTLSQAGVITGLSGLVSSSQYYLSASVAGNTTSTPPSAVGSYVVPIFLALSSTAAILNLDGLYPYSSGNTVCNGRLTLTSGTPVTINDVTAAGTLYWTPYKGNLVSIWNGSNQWSTYTFSQQALTLSGLTGSIPQDIFVFINGGAVTISNLAWSSATARATALTYQDGIEVLTGSTAKRYLGTIYLNNANTTEDSVKNRLVYNRYNQVERGLAVTETAVSWSYGATAFHQVNANAANTFNVVSGIGEENLSARAYGLFQSTSGRIFAAQGIGIDSVTSNSAQITRGSNSNVNNDFAPADAEYNGTLSAGYHSINWLEASQAGGATFYGVNSPQKTGMTATIRM